MCALVTEIRPMLLEVLAREMKVKVCVYIHFQYLCAFLCVCYYELGVQESGGVLQKVGGEEMVINNLDSNSDVEPLLN